MSKPDSVEAHSIPGPGFDREWDGAKLTMKEEGILANKWKDAEEEATIGPNVEGSDEETSEEEGTYLGDEGTDSGEEDSEEERPAEHQTQKDKKTTDKNNEKSGVPCASETGLDENEKIEKGTAVAQPLLQSFGGVSRFTTLRSGGKGAISGLISDMTSGMNTIHLFSVCTEVFGTSCSGRYIRTTDTRIRVEIMKLDKDDGYSLPSKGAAHAACNLEKISVAHAPGACGSCLLGVLEAVHLCHLNSVGRVLLK
ncbi:hypothetical protein U1Q18_014613 [Sarracenia purpurea var. burkii]